MTRTQRGTAVIGAPPIDADVTSPPPIDIGPGATLKLGDDTQSGNFVQPIAGFPRLWPPFSDGAPPAFAVGAGGNGSGAVRGWGGSVGNGGALINNGRIIADGKGQDRALITDKIQSIVIPRVKPTVSGSNFEVLVGFDVTPEMVAFNRLGKRFRPNAGVAQAEQSGQTAAR